MNLLRTGPALRLSPWIALAAVLSALPGGARAAADGLYTSRTPLSRVLSGVGSAGGEQLRAAGTLQRQRVTLQLSSVHPDKLRALLAELLSAPRAPLLWTEQADGLWLLEESSDRHRLAPALQAAKRQELLARIRQEQRRLPDLIERIAAAKDEQVLYDLLKEFERPALLNRLTEEDLRAILAGKAVTFRLEELSPEIRFNIIRRWRMDEQRPGADAGPPGRRGATDYTLSFSNGGSADDDPNLWMAQFDRELQWFSSGVLFPTQLRDARFRLYDRRRVEFPPADPAVPGRRINLDLAADRRPGSDVVSLDPSAFLRRLAEQNGLQLAADGYLRTPYPFALQPPLQDYPLTQALRVAEELWGLTSRWSKADPEVLLVRTVDWAGEDEADVDDVTIARYNAAARPGQRPQLKELVALAELTPQQLLRLEALHPERILEGLTMGSAARPPLEMLRLYSQLPPHLQDEARSPAGLALSAAPQDLVRQTIGRFMIEGIGYIDFIPDEAHFWLEPTEPQDEPRGREPAWTGRIEVAGGGRITSRFYCPAPGSRKPTPFIVQKPAP